MIDSYPTDDRGRRLNCRICGAKLQHTEGAKPRSYHPECEMEARRQRKREAYYRDVELTRAKHRLWSKGGKLGGPR